MLEDLYNLITTRKILFNQSGYVVVDPFSKSDMRMEMPGKINFTYYNNKISFRNNSQGIPISCNLTDIDLKNEDPRIINKIQCSTFYLEFTEEPSEEPYHSKTIKYKIQIDDMELTCKDIDQNNSINRQLSWLMQAIYIFNNEYDKKYIKNKPKGQSSDGLGILGLLASLVPI
jgi:hypothetical protein